MQAQVEITTGHILAIGEFPAGSPDPETVEIVDLTIEQEATLQSNERGQRVIAPNGSVTITPPVADAVQESRQRQADALDAAVASGDVSEIGRLVAVALRNL